MLTAMADDGSSSIDATPLLEAASAERVRIGRFNLAILGGTGVGKSSLVNAIFGKKLARTGVGMPVTKGIDYYTNSDKTLGIWDFEGFEVGMGRSPAEIVRENLQIISAGPQAQQIAAVWYCIASTSARLQPAEIEVIRQFRAQGLPVVLVLTKVTRVKNPVTGKWTVSDETQQLRDWLTVQWEWPDDSTVDLPINALALTAAIDQGKFGGPAHGLDELLTKTFDLTPEDSRDALRVAQQLSLPLKREMCRRVIAAAAAASTAAAIQPIPVADALLIAPIQFRMMGKIAAYYGLDLKVVFSVQALTQMAVQFAGKALARNVLRLIPGGGNLINGTIAMALTTATGEAWLRLCEAVFLGKIDLKDVERKWQDYAPTVLQVINAMRTRGVNK
ncbi:GTPase [Antribacter gilvus]|uniref:GTPase n=1 Tax=Antribacter gilvus TaxID=2304675 RepID=UPI001F0CD38F|nr:GTPase [Antribacter gilvus]